MIHGAQSRENSIRQNDLADRLGMDNDFLSSELDMLAVKEYVEINIVEGVRYIHLTSTGIIAASSIYS
jgi:Mn-dependent DtxR family transcriptional regulator